MYIYIYIYMLYVICYMLWTTLFAHDFGFGTAPRLALDALAPTLDRLWRILRRYGPFVYLYIFISSGMYIYLYIFIYVYVY